MPISVNVKGLTPGATYRMRLVVSNIDDSREAPDRVFATHVPAFDGLPDGRAYEQASPVEKNGGDARGRWPGRKPRATADAITFISTRHPRREGAQELPLYLASRGARAGPPRASCRPPQPATEAYVIGWTARLLEVFDVATELGADRRRRLSARARATMARWRRSSTTARASKRLPRLTYAGASADGSR